MAAPETPAAQGAHSEVPIAYVLAGHVEAVYAHRVAPWVLKAPSAQGRHTEAEVAPVEGEYVPAGQGVALAEEGGQKWPAGQREPGTSHTELADTKQPASYSPFETATQSSASQMLLGSPASHSAWPAGEEMKAVDSPARCHCQPAHAEDAPHSWAASLSPTQAGLPAATPSTAANSDGERTEASVPPTARAPQDFAAALQGRAALLN